MGLWDKKKESSDQSKSDADLLIEKLGPAIGAAIEEKLKPMQEGFTKLQGEWDGLKAEATRESQPDPNKNSDGTELTEEQKLARQTNATFALSVQTNARITENDCISQVRSEYPQLVAELQSTFANTPWQRKANADYPQYCQNVVDMLIGRASRQGGLRYDRNSSKFMIEDSAAKTGGSESPLNDPELTWRDDRGNRTMTASEQLAKLRIDPEKFSEWAKATGQVI